MDVSCKHVFFGCLRPAAAHCLSLMVWKLGQLLQLQSAVAKEEAAVLADGA